MLEHLRCEQTVDCRTGCWSVKHLPQSECWREAAWERRRAISAVPPGGPEWPKLVSGPVPVQPTVLTLTLGLAYLHCVRGFSQQSGPGATLPVLILLSVSPAKLTQK